MQVGPVEPLEGLHRLDQRRPLLGDALSAAPPWTRPVLLPLHDRERRLPAGLAAAEEHELPDEVVERRAEVPEDVAEDQRQILERRLRLDAASGRCASRSRGRTRR